MKHLFSDQILIKKTDRPVIRDLSAAVFPGAGKKSAGFFRFFQRDIHQTPVDAVITVDEIDFVVEHDGDRPVIGNYQNLVCADISIWSIFQVRRQGRRDEDTLIGLHQFIGNIIIVTRRIELEYLRVIGRRLSGDDRIPDYTGMLVLRHVLDDIFNNFCQIAEHIIVRAIRIILHLHLEGHMNPVAVSRARDARTGSG